MKAACAPNEDRVHGRREAEQQAGAESHHRGEEQHGAVDLEGQQRRVVQRH
jgi:hypothetical protein